MVEAGVQPRKSRPKIPLALPAAFFNRDAAVVARQLLGKLLIRRYAPVANSQPELLVGRVVEAEAYLGAIDPGSHAFAGKTARNAVLFGPPGIAYVYFIYGNHYCLNVSCQPAGSAEGVLFRALEPIAGLATMAKLRGLNWSTQPGSPSPARLCALTSGPGRLTQAMAITRQAHNGIDLTSPRSELFLADDGWRPERVVVTPRINVTKAADRLLRYLVAGNPCVSGKRVR